jgi:hypothetical protein
LKAVSFVFSARIIMFYEELFDEVAGFKTVHDGASYFWGLLPGRRQ